MPWQPVPSLIIIGGAFNVIAGLMWSVQRLAYGKDKAICQDVFDFSIDRRDDRVLLFRKLVEEEKKRMQLLGKA
eukprot:CAMPEP_0194027614 /NCGR_PEP_ID=MMETSP0009_2-20130614/1749_1 /TAXON_ID=210454 /ORGANISM="Grammatophora oceanica, Strain CCMP 410" /LENGTH=73 /DNA_ID=CAMNT_0038666751 /DNA_START=55 /DNA_END=276 /DNA_ORIENTATION=+